MAGERCIQIGSGLYRVTKDFDDTPGSDDMVALQELHDALMKEFSNDNAG